MNKKNILLGVFALVALVQIGVIMGMILTKEKVIADGVEYKFKTAPIDPYDPFTGKYVTLEYELSNINIEDTVAIYNNGQTVYVYLTTDEKGYAKVYNVADNAYMYNYDYVTATVSWYSYPWLRVQFPFNRFNMNEYKAKAAEDAYNHAARNKDIDCYAAVRVKDGDGVVTGIFIDNIPILEYIEP